MKPFVTILAVKAAPGVGKQVKNVDIDIVAVFCMQCKQFIECQDMLLLVIVLRKMWHSGINREHALHINNGRGAFIMDLSYDFQVIVGYDEIRNVFTDIIYS